MKQARRLETLQYTSHLLCLPRMATLDASGVHTTYLALLQRTLLRDLGVDRGTHRDMAATQKALANQYHC